MPPKISIFIITKNEADIIEANLKQASKLATEIIVVDSGSTDQTVAIAKRYSDKVYHQDWLGYGPQKNYALSLCSNEWVLSLDADEVLTDELITEIKSLAYDKDAYQIARRFFIADRFVRFGGYYPDYQLRLFKKSRGRFCDSPVHESIEMLMPLGAYSKIRNNYPKLINPLNHYAYDSISDMKASFSNYAELHKARQLGIVFAVISYCYVFLYRFFVRLGFLDGLLGLCLAQLHANYSFKKKLGRHDG